MVCRRNGETGQGRSKARQWTWDMQAAMIVDVKIEYKLCVCSRILFFPPQNQPCQIGIIQTILTCIFTKLQYQTMIHYLYSTQSLISHTCVLVLHYFNKICIHNKIDSFNPTYDGEGELSPSLLEIASRYAKIKSRSHCLARPLYTAN